MCINSERENSIILNVNSSLRLKNADSSNIFGDHSGVTGVIILFKLNSKVDSKYGIVVEFD